MYLEFLYNVDLKKVFCEMIVDITKFFEYISQETQNILYVCMYECIYMCVCMYVIIDMQLDE